MDIGHLRYGIAIPERPVVDSAHLSDFQGGDGFPVLIPDASNVSANLRTLPIVAGEGGRGTRSPTPERASI